MSIFQTNISLLNKFLKQFAPCFSKKQLAMFTILVYALFKDYKRNSPLKREEVCNVGVAAVFVSSSKPFPIDIVPYLPADEFPRGKNNSRFKDKIQIALELFDTYSKTVDFSGTVFDSWYATTRFLTHIHKTGQVFYSEIKSNRNIFTLLDKNALFACQI